MTSLPPAGPADRRATPAYVMGIDCGSQSAKVSIFDAAGRPVASGQHLLAPMHRPQHGVVVHPDDDLWTSITAAVRQTLAAFATLGHTPAEIGAVGLCTIRCCKAFLDERGQLTEPVISWMDQRAYRPYVPTDPRVRWATTSSGYITHRLTGETCDSAANSIALQWPINTDTWQWHDDDAVVVKYGCTREQLFRLEPPASIAGTITPEAAAVTGLAVGTPVVHTANDKAVEMLAVGTSNADADGGSPVLVSLGTYICAMTAGSDNHPSPADFWTNFACAPGRYLYESGGIRRGMWTMTWLLDLLGPEFAAHAAAAGLSREHYIEPEAAQAPPGSDGLMTVLDWLAADDKPFRKGVMIGFDARHTRGHLYRSIIEAIALTMKHHVDLMMRELGRPAQAVVVSGGGSHSDLVMGTFADVFGVPAKRPIRAASDVDGPAASAASLGAAMCAAAAIGLHASLDVASSQMALPLQEFAPDAARHDLYADIGRHLATIRTHTDPILQATHALFH